jgi:hypothetical protein
MLERRDFLKSSLCGGVTYLTLPMLASASAERDGGDANRALSYRLSRQVPTQFYDGKRCWCHPRAGIVPGVGTNGSPRVVMTMNTLSVSGSDVFKAMHVLHTDDLGKTWSEPRQSESLAIRHETIDGTRRPVAALASGNQDTAGYGTHGGLHAGLEGEASAAPPYILLDLQSRQGRMDGVAKDGHARR